MVFLAFVGGVFLGGLLGFFGGVVLGANRGKDW
jgi:hypothetical protein